MSKAVEAAVDGVIRTAISAATIPPQERTEAPQPRWTLKRLVGWVKETFDIDCCRETLRKLMKRLGFSWKKARKLLNKADPLKRAAYLERLEGLLEQALDEQCLLVYIDEAHLHLDTHEGYGWSICGERFWVSSSSPGLEKVSLYGLYLYNLAQVRILPYSKADQFNTIDVLKRLRLEFPDVPIKLVWDGASYHRAKQVQTAAQVLDIDLVPLPAYSPDFMPVEHLWHWLREEVGYHACYATALELTQQVEQFEQRTNKNPIAVADRLWVQSHLDPEVEKLRVPS